MTRPQIIRADTLDLQDKTSPTAQDHSRQPQHPAPLGVGPAAPHQQASLRQVDSERISEESNLQNDTWSDGKTLREDPGSDDERTVVASDYGDHDSQRDEPAVRLNGGMSGTAEDADIHDGDVDEDLDDDMMDKISSSPSIDDGGYSLSSLPTTWPPGTTPTRSPATPESSCVNSSSPFTTTPIHFPLSVAAARRPKGVPASSADMVCHSSSQSSPTPFLSPPPKVQKQSSEHHRGEYGWTSDADTDTESSTVKGEPDRQCDVSPQTGHMMKVEGRLQQAREEFKGSLTSDLDEEEMSLLLQPVLSPIQEPLDEALENSLEVHDTADDDSWTTDSDLDSWDEEAENDDSSDDVLFSKDSRYIDSGWGGECLREPEDIDFEFVYALHTFVATVEGQANATKGDTMVLLDDSNSYWWLVRVVKDSSIGYLPAEHIETPTERLARLNKHRNIDLSATMLGDTAEKTKNPLKKAIRRRNAKTVQFAPPTYVEASDYDYSSDEGGEEELFGGADPNQAQTQSTEKSDMEQDDTMKVEPLKVNGANKEQKPASNTEPVQDPAGESSKSNEENQRTSDEIISDRPLDPKVSRNGTLRNTDSFFKDDNAETRKITLTPNLLRDDSSSSTTGSRERGPSLESLEKNGFADKVKDDKKRKEKKPGMLSGLFKRKDKKTKGALDSFDSDTEKVSAEYGRSSPQPKESTDERPSTDQGPTSPQRHPSKGKLQKPNRNREDSPSKTAKGMAKGEEPEAAAVQDTAQKDAATSKGPASQLSSTSTSTMRLVAPEQEESATSNVEQRVQSPEARSRSNSTASKLNPMNMLKSQQPDDGEPRPEKVKKAKQRVQLDDFDSEEEKVDPFEDPASAHPASSKATDTTSGRLSESPVQISAADAQIPAKDAPTEKDQVPDPHQPPGLTADTSSQETPSPVSTPSPDDSPSTAEPPKATLPASHPNNSLTVNTSAAMPPPSRPAPVPNENVQRSPPDSSESAALPAWSDASLRAYLDDGSDIKDTLLLINDTTGVVPVGRDHPLMSRMFVEETRAVTQLGGELDLLLTNWLEAKKKKHRAVVPVASR